MFTILVIVLTVAVSLWAFNKPGVIERYGMSAYGAMKNGEWDRLITHGFLHGDFNHLFINMLTLFFFGPTIENFFATAGDQGELGGSLMFAVLYFSGLVISSLPDLFQQQNNKQFLSIGASGAIAAVLFTYVVINPLGIIYVYFIPAPAFVWAIVYLAYNYYSNQDARQRQTRINFAAHLAGAAWGAIFTIALGLANIIPIFLT